MTPDRSAPEDLVEALNDGWAAAWSSRKPPSATVGEILAPTVARLIEDAVGERLAGVRWRVEVACDGYANLMDDDVPHDMDEASYQEGAREAAEQIRALLHRANASQTPSEAPRSHEQGEVAPEGHDDATGLSGAVDGEKP